jgi:hypothetical protein
LRSFFQPDTLKLKDLPLNFILFFRAALISCSPKHAFLVCYSHRSSIRDFIRRCWSVQVRVTVATRVSTKQGERLMEMLTCCGDYRSGAFLGLEGYGFVFGPLLKFPKRISQPRYSMLQNATFLCCLLHSQFCPNQFFIAITAQHESSFSQRWQLYFYFTSRHHGH